MSKRILSGLAVLMLLASLACTLTAPPAEMAGEVQNSPAPPAAATITRTLHPTITPTTRPGATATKVVSPSCTVSTGIENGALNVRACAGLACAIVGTVAQGDVITITEAGDQWLGVDAGSLAGYVKAEFCEVKP